MLSGAELTHLTFLLLCGHFVADFAIQTEFVATNKNRHIRLTYPAEKRTKMQVLWPHLLTAHCFHHGLMVYLVTRNLTLSFLEISFHWITDFAKSEKWFDFHVDQFIHIATKGLWVYLLYKNLV